MNTQMTTTFSTIANKLSAADVSMNTQMSSTLATIADKLSSADVSMNTQMSAALVNITNKLSSIDVSMNQQIIKMNETLIKTATILETLTNNDTSNNMVELMEKINVNSTNNQNTLIEYIGQYIVIPLYEQRLSDIGDFYYTYLYKNVICEIERFMTLFKNEDWVTFNRDFTIDIRLAIYNKLSSVKRESFSKFLNTTPGALCYQDMTPESIMAYKRIRKLVHLNMKALDILGRVESMNNKISSYEAQIAIFGIDSEILNDSETLQLLVICLESHWGLK